MSGRLIARPDKNEFFGFLIGNNHLIDDKLEHINTAYMLSMKLHKKRQETTGRPHDFNHQKLVAQFCITELSILDWKLTILALLYNIEEENVNPLVHTYVRQNVNVRCADTIATLVRRPEESTEQHLKKIFRQGPRATFIKLSDHLHSMRVLENISQPDRHKILQETEALYIPLALQLYNKLKLGQRTPAKYIQCQLKNECKRLAGI